MAGFWGKKEEEQKDSTQANVNTLLQSGNAAIKADPVKPTVITKPENTAVIASTQSLDADMKNIPVAHFLGAGTSLKANVYFNSAARIDGALQGEVTCADLLIIGPKGVVEGPIQCRGLLLLGRCVGPIRVEGMADLRSGSTCSGTLDSKSIRVEESCQLNCEVRVVSA